VASAVALALHARPDVRLDAPPGEPVRFTAADDAALLPFADCVALRDGELDAAAWTARCAAVGLAGSDLGAAAAARAAAAPAAERAEPAAR
jgi:hypothetical protein